MFVQISNICKKRELSVSLLIFCFLFLRAALAFCEQTTKQKIELTLDEAVNLAVEHNLNLQKLKVDLAASGYSEQKLWSELFPAINANMSAGYKNALFSGNPSGTVGFNYSVGLGIILNLHAGIPYTFNIIKLAHQSNILKYEDAVNQLSIQVTKRFFALAAEEDNLRLLEEILNLAQRQFSRSEVSFRNGLVGEMSLLQSSLALENARYNLSAAAISYANNMMEFLAMLGKTSEENVTLLGETHIVKIEADADALINQYLHLRPDIIRGKQEIERLTNVQSQTMLQSRAPQLSLTMNWSSSNFNPFSDTFEARATLSIPIDPWIPGTSRERSISSISDQIEKAKLDIAITEDAARTQIHSLSALLRNFWDSILIARLSLVAAQRGYQLTEQGFLRGTVEELTLEDVRNNMANARQRLFQIELSYFNMILDLSAALNVDWKYLIQTFGVQSE
ncbi:MAG: TolC family protein [Treponema sp.]|nr:TolC family protein [Treponema sp.]MCL2252520.1 TolC family protein [Treponema sp.]